MHLLESNFPGLTLLSNNKVPYLKGALCIPDNTGQTTTIFEIEIHYQEGYPLCFPLVIECSHSFPHEADWHCYPDTGACCLMPPIEEAIWCLQGFDILRFMHEVVISFFANQYHRKLNGFYLHGEYSHGTQGLVEYYEKIFGCSGRIEVLLIIRKVNAMNQIYCQTICPICGNQKVSRCHLKLVRNLIKLKANLENDYFQILKWHSDKN